jgi:D-aminoacyl-tRNA deacylase
VHRYHGCLPWGPSDVRIALVHSRQDPGGRTIREHIDRLLSASRIGRFPLEEHDLSFHQTEGRLIEQDRLDRALSADLIIFLSRHASVDPTPVLTTHVTGNIGNADLGGEPGAVAVAAPDWMHAVLCGLSRHAPKGYRVSYEVTHHGPSELCTPSLFVEIGSTEKEWRDGRAGDAVARSVLGASPENVIAVLGIGGTHYARRETEIALRSRAAFGHIVHSRDTGLVGQAMLACLMEKSRAEAVYIDKKALNAGEAARLAEIIDSGGFLRLTETGLLQMKHLSLETWLAIRDMARITDPHAEIISIGPAREGVPRLIKLPPDLVREAFRADAAGLKEGLLQLPIVALSSRETPVMPLFITTEEDPSGVLNDLISLCVTLISRGENTAIEGDLLIIRKSRFDPSAARKLGVPEGPLFGELMKGRAITVNGREITPAMVCISNTNYIRIPGKEKKE